jgi:hypothetical protein
MNPKSWATIDDSGRALSQVVRNEVKIRVLVNFRGMWGHVRLPGDTSTGEIPGSSLLVVGLRSGRNSLGKVVCRNSAAGTSVRKVHFAQEYFVARIA